ncbi:sensor histidine kinase [Sulfurimonas sp. MAG313]|nr:ATP-binding protein [Sulfurimonas sp. MAG313]MDF1881458.1 sensor histidine kinase [Sulfurimonas sp. MAG313]
MLKLHQIFFLNFLIIFIGTLLSSSLVAYLSIKTTTINENKLQLKKQISLLQMQLPFVEDLDKFVKNIHEKSDLRVTLIDEHGLVLAESNKNKKMMDNHVDRPEIIGASIHEYGFVIRYSDTIKTDFLYIAKKLDFKGKSIFFRLSVSLETVMEEFYTLWFRLAVVFSAFVLISLFMAYSLSKKIRHDITQITEYLREISDKNYKAIIKPEHFSEFLYIALTLKNLAKKLNNRDKQKRKYTARLRLINKQRNDILSAISHEFKNPIASIQGYAETLVDDPDTSSKIRLRFLEKIMQNSKKITSMIDRLSLSVKLENEDLEMKASTFDLCELTQEVIMNLGKKYKDRQMYLSGQEFIVYADKTMIETVIINLIDNAMKYSQEDVTITIMDNKLSVLDKGMGIAEHELDKITSKFYRVQKNTWDNSMGLGLAIVTYVLKIHDSTLMIESKEGEGSIFAFDLSPLQKQISS